MKIEFNIDGTGVKPEKNKWYFVRDKGDNSISVAVIAEWDANKEVLYFDIDDNPSYSTIRYFKEKYTIISEVNSIKFGV